MKWIKRFGVLVLGLALFVLLLLGVGPKVVPLDSILARQLQIRLHRPTYVQSVDLRVLGGIELTVSGLKVEELPEFGKRPFLSIHRLHLRVLLLPLFFSRVVIQQAEIDGMELSLVRNAEGILNVDSFPAPAGEQQVPDPPSDPSPFQRMARVLLRQAEIRNSALYLADLESGRFSRLPLEPARFSSKGDARQVDFEGTLHLPGLSLDLTGGAASLNSAPTLQKVHFRVRMDASVLGKEFSPLFPGLRCNGTMDLDLEASGPPDGIQLRVEVKGNGLRIQSNRLPGEGGLALEDLVFRTNTTMDIPSRKAEVHELDLLSRSAGLHVVFQGTLPSLRQLHEISGTFSVEAGLENLSKALGTLLPVPASFKGTLTATGKAEADPEEILRTSGTLRIKNLEIHPRTASPPYTDPLIRMDFEASLEPGNKRIRSLNLSLSAGAAQLDVVTRRNVEEGLLRLNAKANFGRLQHFLAILGLQPKKLRMQGTGVVSARVTGLAALPRLSAKVAMVDAGIRYGRILRKPRGVPAELRFHMAMGEDGVRIRELRCVLGPIRIQGNGNLSKDRRRITLTAKLKRVNVERVRRFSPVLADWKPSGTIAVDLSASTPFFFPQREGSIPIPELEGRIVLRGVSFSPIRQKESFRPVLSGTLSADPQRIRLERFSLSLPKGTSTLMAQVEDYTHWPHARFHAKLAADVLDLNTLAALMPVAKPSPDAPLSAPLTVPEKPTSEQEAADAPTVSQAPLSPAPQGEAPGEPGRPASAEKQAGPMDWKTALSGRVEATVERLLFKEYEARNVHLTASLEKGDLLLKRLDGTLFNGNVHAEGALRRIASAPQGNLRLWARHIVLTDAAFAMLKNDVPLFALPLKTLNGTFFLESELSFQGADPVAVLGSLTGKATVRAPEGVHVDFGILGKVSLWQRMFRGSALQRLAAGDFSRFDGNFNMDRGTVHYDLTFRIGDEELIAEVIGTTVLPVGSVDARVRIAGRMVGRDLKRFLAPDGTLPLRLKGTLKDLKPELQLKGSPLDDLLRKLVQP